jgi:hypothetical protein
MRPMSHLIVAGTQREHNCGIALCGYTVQLDTLGPIIEATYRHRDVMSIIIASIPY